jgi:hypothetical protein
MNRDAEDRMFRTAPELAQALDSEAAAQPAALRPAAAVP